MTKITPQELRRDIEHVTLLDVRKPKALMQSGKMIAGAEIRHPFRAADWAELYRGHRLIIYCVHGHEVSQAVCGFLRDTGLDCRYVEGGFEALVASDFDKADVAEQRDGGAGA